MASRKHITEEIITEAMALRAKGWSFEALARKFGFHSTTMRRACDPRKAYQIKATDSNAWIVNHPYVNELHEEERKRFLEVIHKRQVLNPTMGWDYQTKEEVIYKNGKICRRC